MGWKIKVRSRLWGFQSLVLKSNTVYSVRRHIESSRIPPLRKTTCSLSYFNIKAAQLLPPPSSFHLKMSQAPLTVKQKSPQQSSCQAPDYSACCPPIGLLCLKLQYMYLHQIHLCQKGSCASVWYRSSALQKKHSWNLGHVPETSNSWSITTVSLLPLSRALDSYSTTNRILFSAKEGKAAQQNQGLRVQNWSYVPSLLHCRSAWAASAHRFLGSAFPPFRWAVTPLPTRRKCFLYE